MFKINNLTAFFFTYFCPRFYGNPPSPSANTTTQTTTTPWSGAAQYLTGNSTYNKATGMFDNNGKGPTGIYEEIGNYANQYSNLTPQQQNLKAMSDNAYAGRYGTMQNTYNDSTALGNKIAGGAYDTNFSPVGNARLTNSGMTNARLANAGMTNAGLTDAGVTNAGMTNAGMTNAGMTNAGMTNASLTNSGMTNASMTNAGLTTNNFGQSMAGMGAVDPTSAMSNVLRGDPTSNPYLDQMNQANVNTAMRGYNDAIQNVNQQVMPGINNDAFAAGQYGGSRQGIAQGLALQGMDRSARDLGISAMDSGNQLYGSAFQNAQNNQATAANQMTGYGLQNSQYNIGQSNDMSKFNAGNAIDLSKFNAGQSNQNSQFNASNANQNSQFNAGNAIDLSKYNSGQSNQNSQFNAANANQNSQFNAGNANQNSQFNAGNANQNNQFNAGNAIDLSKYNSGQANDISKFNAGNTIQNSQFNAGNANQNSQFNANLGLQNQVQQMAQKAQNMGNATTGNELNNTALTRLFSGQDQNYSNQMTNANLEQQQKLDMLNMKLGAYSPGANLGGSSTATQPYYDNTLGNIGGMAAGAGGLISALKS